MSNYHNDQPITGCDDNPDRLNRENFAAHLAEILTLAPSDDCLTVSLEGEWGYGKTSVVNLVKKAAGKREEPCGRDHRASKSKNKQPVLFKVFSPITLSTSVPVAETAGCVNYEIDR